MKITTIFAKKIEILVVKTLNKNPEHLKSIQEKKEE